MVVTFLDGAVRTVERESSWQPFTHDGVALEWCVARTSVDATWLVVHGVRLRGVPSSVVGATIDDDRLADDARARGIVDAHGGPERLRRSLSTEDLARPTETTRWRLPGLGTISDQEITNFLSMKYRVPTIDLGQFEIDADVIALVPEAVCAKHRVIPVSRAGTSIIVAITDPGDQLAIEAVREATSFQVEPVIATEQAIVAAIARYYGGRG